MAPYGSRCGRIEVPFSLVRRVLSFLAALGLAVSLTAQTAAPDPMGTPKRTPQELEKLLAPIALYPDSLVALILPASTFSADVVLAARFVAAHRDPAQIDQQPWDDSVKGLARYPALVAWMDQNLEWTRDVGEAFVAQPAEVMSTVQRLREQAKNSGWLTDTPQQKVVVEESAIRIVPAQPDVIYIPRYDPTFLVVRRPFLGTFISFGSPCPVGRWLYYDCDWPRQRVWMHHRHPNWHYRHDDWDHRRRHHDHPGSVWSPPPHRPYVPRSSLHRTVKMPEPLRPGVVRSSATYDSRRHPDRERGAESTRRWSRPPAPSVPGVAPGTSTPALQLPSTSTAEVAPETVSPNPAVPPPEVGGPNDASSTARAAHDHRSRFRDTDGASGILPRSSDERRASERWPERRRDFSTGSEREQERRPFEGSTRPDGSMRRTGERGSTQRTGERGSAR